MADPATYTKGDWSNLTPAATKAKMENIEDGIKAANDALVAETDAGRAITQAANAAAQRTALDVDSKAEVTGKANAAQAAAEATASADATAKANAAQAAAEGTASAALSGHVADADPHAQYQKESDLPADLATIIHGLTAKTTPADADEIGFWDSVANALKNMTFANLWTWAQSKLHGATAKATPADADTIPYTDTEASNVIKKMSFANIWTWVQGKIHGALNKDALVDADKIGIIDTEASNVVKTTTWSNVKAKIWTALGALIAGGTAKATPLDADKFGYSSAADSNASRYVLWSSIKSVLATAFKHGGSNEIATATPGPNVIPKTGAGSTLAAGFLPQATNSAIGGVLLGANGGAIKDTKMPDGATAIISNDTWTDLTGFTFGVCAHSEAAGEITLTPSSASSYMVFTAGAINTRKYLILRAKRPTVTTATFVVREHNGSAFTLDTTLSLTTEHAVHRLLLRADTVSVYVYPDRAGGTLTSAIIDWLWIGDYSYLDGSLSEEAARFANEGGDAPGVPVAANMTIAVTPAGTNFVDGETITVHGKVYTAKTTLTGAEGEFKIGPGLGDSFVALRRAVLYDTPAIYAFGGSAPVYSVAAAHTTVSAAYVSPWTSFIITALASGIPGNLITVTKSSSASFTLPGSTLSGGLGAGGAKIISMVGNNIAGGRTRPAAAMIERTNTSLIGYEATVKLALGATYTFPAGGTFDWVALAYDANIGGADQGTAAGGSTVTMAGANSKLWIRRRS